MSKLTIKNHDRDVAGYQYIYPVISRRAGGLSIGINFNTNNACNWHCVYCQVPNLTLGTAPDLDLEKLTFELSNFLQDVLSGTFYDRFELTPNLRVIKDIAISGNGEPTSVKAFTQAIRTITRVVEHANIIEPYQYVLISNGSLMHKKEVQIGLDLFHQFKGQLWFKLDSGTETGRAAINHSALSLQRQKENLVLSAKLCTTWIQTCVLQYQGRHDIGLTSPSEQSAYLALLSEVIQQAPLAGVMLYSLARPSHQSEAAFLTSVSLPKLNQFADKIRQLGLKVMVSA